MPQPKLVVGRFAAAGAALALAAGCTPERIARDTSGLPRSPPRAAAAAPQKFAAERPSPSAPIEAMRPFVLTTGAADRARAVQCLSQAVYYEAAREPLAGQQAVAQVVLNRVRHPAYPKSVCGVVYQGAANTTGCQFTFTCDGSLRWKPQPLLWARAEDVARRALAGYVDAQVGSATHYHAVYVSPYWAPTLVRMTQVGQHIFYRWTGPWGEPAAFTGRYAGREAVLTPAVLRSEESQDEPPTRRVALGGRTYAVAEFAAGRAPGVLQPTRRRPTPDEVRRINDDLAAAETRLAAQSATAPP
jgi:spore germination cell wall hydrolase CwlJ-like protein